MKSGLSF